MAKFGKGKSKKKVKEKAKPKPKAKKVKDEEGLRGIVRLADNDLDGHLPLHKALLYVKGIGHSLRFPVARLISNELGINESVRIGELSEDQVEKINDILYNLDESKLPAFLLNRRKDFATGKARHLIMNDLLFAMRQDIERKIRTRTWQGYRHSRGKKVRGQRTKNTGRRGMTVGVIRRKDMKGSGK